jgi:hypothetical protein
MRDESGSKPPDSPFVPVQPGFESLPASNGPSAERGTRIEPVHIPGLTLPAPSFRDRKEPEQKDAFREIVETVVFVVVLVLLLKAFMAEAFVIPTGSMATTLWGYHKPVVCPECGFHFPLNMSKEMDSQEQVPERINGCTCPNCRLLIDSSNSPQFRQ